MAKKPTEEAVAAAAEKTAQPQAYEIEQLKEHAYELFGVGPFVVEGAMQGVEGLLTIEDARQIIARFQAGRVKGPAFAAPPRKGVR